MKWKAQQWIKLMNQWEVYIGKVEIACPQNKWDKYWHVIFLFPVIIHSMLLKQISSNLGEDFLSALQSYFYKGWCHFFIHLKYFIVIVIIITKLLSPCIKELYKKIKNKKITNYANFINNIFVTWGGITV